MKNKISEIKMDFELKKGKTNYLTHNFHTYPAKFIPQIPHTTISMFTSPGEVVLDPFGGCGTTIVEAKLLKRIGVAVDINPVANLTSRAKTTKLSKRDLVIIPELLKIIKVDIQKYYSKKEDLLYKIPQFYNREHWFKKDVTHELAIIKHHIDKLNNQSLKNYLLTAFSSIIVSVSNQESDTRFAAIEKKSERFRVLNCFSDKLKKMERRILDFSALASDEKTKVHLGDARDLSFLSNNSVDHIVTSPPYANTYDYYLYHKFRIYWLGHSIKETQNKEIGSRNRHSSKKEGIETFEKDLSDCLKEMSRVLKPKKYAVIVIGDSIIRGKLIHADILIKNIAEKNRFRIVKKISYDLRKNSKMFNPKFTNQKKEEHIIFLKNEK